MRTAIMTITLLLAMPAAAESAGRFGDDAQVRLLFSYGLDAGASNRVRFGFGLARSLPAGAPEWPSNPPAASLSCEGCSDAEYRRLAVIYGLLLVAGYYAVRDAYDD